MSDKLVFLYNAKIFDDTDVLILECQVYIDPELYLHGGHIKHRGIFIEKTPSKAVKRVCVELIDMLYESPIMREILREEYPLMVSYIEQSRC